MYLSRAKKIEHSRIVRFSLLIVFYQMSSLNNIKFSLNRKCYFDWVWWFDMIIIIWLGRPVNIWSICHSRHSSTHYTHIYIWMFILCVRTKFYQFSKELISTYELTIWSSCPRPILCQWHTLCNNQSFRVSEIRPGDSLCMVRCEEKVYKGIDG